MLTAAACRPYDWLSDDQLIGTLRHWYTAYLPGDCDPPSPAGTVTAAAECPRELEDLMRQCWSGDEVQRPTFADINVFLAVKSAGFCPPPTTGHRLPRSV